jgi:hypothetical protein
MPANSILLPEPSPANTAEGEQYLPPKTKAIFYTYSKLWKIKNRTILCITDFGCGKILMDIYTYVVFLCSCAQ